MTIQIPQEALEKACREMIESILICLPNAFKGTVYLIGPPSDMTAVRVTSGVINPERNFISWGLPEQSDYNPPGKSWLLYRDEPGRALEAMGWCVERQQSWTAEDPRNDSRSVRLQVEGVWSDFHHMEPVLIRKQDLYAQNGPSNPYPTSFRGETLWQNSEYLVVAVIKIHFQPGTIRIGGPETKIIKKLSRVFGTELLSYQLRQQSLDATRQLAEDRLNSCNILADSLRNVITKSGLIYSLMKLELGFLREQWEVALLKKSMQNDIRTQAIRQLENLLEEKKSDGPGKLKSELVESQNRFLELYLPPEQGEHWVRMQIEQRWNALICEGKFDEKEIETVRKCIDQLKRALTLGTDPTVLARYDGMPEAMKLKWLDLLYKETGPFDTERLGELIDLLGEPHLSIRHKEKCKKSLIRLKALAEIIAQLEDNTNVVLRQILNGAVPPDLPKRHSRKTKHKLLASNSA